MKYTVTQPQYLARLHVWNRLLCADHFVLSDDVVFGHHSSQLRTLFPDPSNQQTRELALTVPVQKACGKSRKIIDRQMAWTNWRDGHLRALARLYPDARNRGEVLNMLAWAYFYAFPGDSYGEIVVGLFAAAVRWLGGGPGVHTCGHSTRKKTTRLADVQEPSHGT